jgi:uncharacterized membrane protein YdjX (TVP38/TMEM64 family)
MHFAGPLFSWILKFGGLGLLVVGIIDSSFLFAPWGNDLLVVALTARHPTIAYVLYYALMSAAGSVIGCLLIDITLRPLGAKGLETHLPKKTLQRVQKKMEQNAGGALAVASLAPPPFPFTAFVMAAAALQYSRKRMLIIIALTRLPRFAVVGFLAMVFGERILRWAKIPVVQWCLIGLIVICTVGSVISVYGWLKRSRAGSADHKQ